MSEKQNTPSSCSLGTHCACARMARALRFLPACPQPSGQTSQTSWPLAVPLVLTVGFAAILNAYWGELGAALGVILGLVLGFILLRKCRF